MLTQLIARFLPSRQLGTPARPVGVPTQLLERADACRGLSAHDALELRRAAMAYLGVVR